MKKLLFTIFAVVGFSTISVANNYVEVKTLQVEELLVVGDPCKDDQDAGFNDCMSNGCTERESMWNSYKEWGNCMSDKGIWG